MRPPYAWPRPRPKRSPGHNPSGGVRLSHHFVQSRTRHSLTQTCFRPAVAPPLVVRALSPCPLPPPLLCRLLQLRLTVSQGARRLPAAPQPVTPPSTYPLRSPCRDLLPQPPDVSELVPEAPCRLSPASCPCPLSHPCPSTLTAQCQKHLVTPSPSPPIRPHWLGFHSCFFAAVRLPTPTCVGGLSTTALPAMSAGASLETARLTG